MKDNMQNQELIPIFLTEGHELLDKALQLIISVEKTACLSDVIDELFRIFHTIKGGAQTFEMQMSAVLAHKLEDLLDFFKEKNIIAKEEKLIDLLFDGVTFLQESINAYTNQKDAMDLNSLQKRFSVQIENIENYLQTKINILNSQSKDIEKNKKEALRENSYGKNFIEENFLLPLNKNIDRNSKDKKLFYITCVIDSKAPIISISTLLVMQRLHEQGKIIFSNLNQDEEFKLVKKEHGFILEIILETLQTKTIIKKECSTADVIDINCYLLSEEIFTIENFSHLAIEDFLSKFWRLKYLSDKEILQESVDFKKSLRSLSSWGEHFLEKHVQNNTLLLELQRKIFFLNKLLLSFKYNDYNTAKFLSENLLQNLWEYFFSLLYNKNYFYSCFLKNNTSIERFEQILRNLLIDVKVRVVFVELEKMPALEWEKIEILTNYFYKFQEQKKRILLFSKEEQEDKVIKILSELQRILPELKLFSSYYQAFYNIE